MLVVGEVIHRSACEETTTTTAAGLLLAERKHALGTLLAGLVRVQQTILLRGETTHAADTIHRSR